MILVHTVTSGAPPPLLPPPPTGSNNRRRVTPSGGGAASSFSPVPSNSAPSKPASTGHELDDLFGLGSMTSSTTTAQSNKTAVNNDDPFAGLF